MVTSVAELVEMCSPQILSGWRPLFSALRTVHSSKTETKDYLLGEYSMGTVTYDGAVVRLLLQGFLPERLLLCREVSGAGV